jgi:arylsulfatase A-like enzyme/Tfp pilus assembly protein PilF
MPRKKKKRTTQIISPSPTNRPVHSDKRWLVAVGALLAVIVLLFFLRDRIFGSVRTAAFKGYNVILITIDTLRADHLPIYGYSNVKTPNFVALAGESLVFQDAIAEIPLTLPSHTSILTGLLPVAHHVRDNATFTLDPAKTTLAEILKSNGYATAAFVSSAVLDSRYGLGQGFEFYFDNLDESGVEMVPGSGLERRGQDTEMEVEEWLAANRNRKTFVWMHLYDPHDPYKPPEPYATEYRTHPYDGEIAYTDEVIGKLLSRLRELDQWQKTIVILTADHGESLGEHGEPTHGVFLYDSTIKVPLLIRLPNGPRKSIADLVRHVDIAPTILDLVGIDTPSYMQGKSLLRLISGNEGGRSAFSESRYAEIHYGWSPLRSITTKDFKYVDAPKPELYSRKMDPHEANNIYADNRDIVKKLKDELQDIRTKNSDSDIQPARKIDPEMEERLRALGYVAGSVESTPESLKVDPKDKIHLHRSLVEAYVAMTEKQYSVAIEKLRPLIDKNSKGEYFNVTEARYLAGIAYAQVGQYPEAIAQLREVVRSQPNNLQAAYNLAYAYQVIGDYPAAEKYYKLTLDSDANYLPAIVGLGKLYKALRHDKEAELYFTRAVSSYQQSLAKTKGVASRSRTYAALAEIYFNRRDLPEAEKNQKAAIELTPREPNLHYNLAQMYEALGRTREAMEEYKKEIAINSSHYMALTNLGLLYRQSGDLNAAIAAFQQVLRIIPGSLQASYTLAETELMANKNLDEAENLAKQILQQKPEFQPARKLLSAIQIRIAQSK